MGRVLKFGKFLYLGIVLTCQGFSVFFWENSRKLISPKFFLFSFQCKEIQIFFFIEVVIWRSFSIKKQLLCFKMF